MTIVVVVLFFYSWYDVLVVASSFLAHQHGDDVCGCARIMKHQIFLENEAPNFLKEHICHVIGRRKGILFLVIWEESRI